MKWMRSGVVFRGVATPADLRRAGQILGADGSAIEHAFEPFGLSYGALAAEVRVAIHTWPEYQLLTVDAYAREILDLPTLLAELGWVPVSDRLDLPRLAELLEKHP